jgi:hypothetical protein
MKTAGIILIVITIFFVLVTISTIETPCHIKDGKEKEASEFIIKYMQSVNQASCKAAVKELYCE